MHQCLLKKSAKWEPWTPLSYYRAMEKVCEVQSTSQRLLWRDVKRRSGCKNYVRAATLEADCTDLKFGGGVDLDNIFDLWPWPSSLFEMMSRYIPPPNFRSVHQLFSHAHLYLIFNILYNLIRVKPMKHSSQSCWNEETLCCAGNHHLIDVGLIDRSAPFEVRQCACEWQMRQQVFQTSALSIK